MTAATHERPGGAALLADQLRYAVVDFWRARVVLIFTFALPLVWLLVIGAVAGNETLDEGSGLRVMQYATPSAVAMGVLFASYPVVAISLAEARDTGILKRLRGTPLPAWTYLAGRVGAAVVFALASVAAALLVGVVGFGVQIVGSSVAATLVTLVLGIGCFAALGLAVAAVSPTLAFAQAASVGTAVVLTFLSGLYTLGGELPAWLDRVGAALPLQPFAELLQGQFDPFAAGSGWDGAQLAVVAAWAVGAAALAAGFLGREHSRGGRPRTAGTAVPRPAVAARRVVRTGSPSAAGLVLDQARAANRSAWRDASATFFALVMPVGLYAFFVATQGRGGEVDGVPFETSFAGSMVVWGVAVAVFINLPEAVAVARDRGVLKRLRGTPLRPWQYLAGRTMAGLWQALVIAVLVLAVAVLAFDATLSAAALLVGLLVLAAGTLTMTACGFALAAVAPDAKAVGAVGLVVLLPLAFFSDVFVIGGPEWMRTVGGLFPLRHFQNAMALAWDPNGPQIGWGHLAVLLIWLGTAMVVAVRFFRWEPRTGS